MNRDIMIIHIKIDILIIKIKDVLRRNIIHIIQEKKILFKTIKK